MTTCKKVATLAVLATTLSAIMLTSGCLVAAAGAAGGVFYAKGDLESTLQASPIQIASAAEKVFTDMKITKLSAVSSDLDAEVIGRSSTDKKITIKSKAKGQNFSTISIRVGVFGDNDLSRIILDNIKKKL
jgi:hypothetical protein